MTESMKYYESIRRKYPETVSKDQFYQIAHISKATALHLLQNGLLRYFALSLVQRQEAQIIQYLRKVPYTKDQPRRFPRFSVQLRHYTKNLEAHATHQKFS